MGALRSSGRGTSQDFTTRTGTNVEKIDNTSGAWFMPSMKKLDPYSLPHDHHELIAMIAPRAVVALGNQDFEWLGGESGWKSINVAKEVWKAFGVPEAGYVMSGLLRDHAAERYWIFFGIAGGYMLIVFTITGCSALLERRLAVMR